MLRRHHPAPQTTAPRRRPSAAGSATHALGILLLELGFRPCIRALYRREVLLPDDFRLLPGSLIASNHQREIDGPLLGAILVQRRRLRLRWPLPIYATREDLFEPGILARLSLRWPRSFAALLQHVSLTWLFRLSRAEPMRRVQEFTVGETLRALCEAGCGDADCATVLNARGRREFAVSPGTLRVREAATCTDPRLAARHGLRRLTRPALRKIAPGFRATVDAQIRNFAQQLDAGNCLYFYPQGTVSTDGRFGRVRAGFFRLCHAAATPPWIQPAALGYDTLAPGRSRVVVRIGERLRADTSLDRRAFDAALRQAILRLVPITPSHLLARFLVHGPPTFTQEQLADWLARGHASLTAHGVSLDPLFTRIPAKRLAQRRLRWLARQHLVAREDGRWRTLCPRDAPPGWHNPAGVVRYLHNNLAELVADIERLLPC